MDFKSIFNLFITIFLFGNCSHEKPNNKGKELGIDSTSITTKTSVAMRSEELKKTKLNKKETLNSTAIIFNHEVQMDKPLAYYLEKRFPKEKCDKFIRNFNKQFSNNDILSMREFIAEFKKEGINLPHPIDVIQYKGHSKDFVFSKEQIEIISSIFNRKVDEILKKEKETISSWKILREEFHSNGKLKRKQLKPPRGSYSNYNYDDKGQLKNTDYKSQTISFKDHYIKGKRTSLNFKNNNFSILESFEDGIMTGFYYRFDDAHTNLEGNFKNGTLQNFEFSTNCSCEASTKDGVKENGEMIVPVIKIDYNRKLEYYWENGVFHKEKDKGKNILNTLENTYLISEDKNGRIDSTLYRISKFLPFETQQHLDNQNFNTLTCNKKSSYYYDEDYLNNIRSKIIYDDGCKEIEEIKYFKNGKIKSRKEL